MQNGYGEINDFVLDIEIEIEKSQDLTSAVKRKYIKILKACRDKHCSVGGRGLRIKDNLSNVDIDGFKMCYRKNVWNPCTYHEGILLKKWVNRKRFSR